ncbi:type I polyketide synthase [Oceanobacillus manasiensis]|uniref:type I polyketide synthase n=1 Tax=Oceanobacillus manasiensis TaxID=586413 RepID=UPI000693651E|nr:type I polyketide synthase [Oceanobacillus manasiensis]
MDVKTNYTGLEIAVIGIAGRFPGAKDTEEFWGNLTEGKESISFFSDKALLDAGVDPELLSNSRFVKAKGLFPDIENFDAEFFDYTPGDASLLDPQVRALHEEVYHALEDAGYASEENVDIGLFVGSTGNFAWEMDTLQSGMNKNENHLSAVQFNDKDFAATRIAYSLNLHGPSVTVHSACSTSLYAVDVACRHLLTGGCTLAVAGGSGLTLPEKNGYMHQEGMILSSDGHCRPFDENADGTVEGNGVGVVVLKRLDEAIKDNDRIYAVIRGSASNNDGNRKAGFTAPSIDGQANVIKRALNMADVPSSSISYVETHGTGTNIGDPIEIDGLKKAFSSSHPVSCGIGSLKSNIGHLDVAAGISSLIKTSLALKHKVLPASINFEKPNKKMELDKSPFYVVTETKDWHRPKKDNESDEYYPLRAGVSSFGIGGTNVHLVLEEPPEQGESSEGRDWKLFSLSAHTDEALQRMKKHYLDYLNNASGKLNSSDLAWSLQVGQRNLPKRFTMPYKEIEDLIQRLTDDLDKKQITTSASKPNVYFLFPGQGSQYLGMARQLYESESRFKEELEACLQLVEKDGNTELRTLLLDLKDGDEEKLKGTDIAQIALFVVEYAMSRLLMSWGIRPSGMIGHSIGEYTAASLSGVLSLEEAIRLVMERAKLMKSMPRGSMLSVNASESILTPLLSKGIYLSAVNSPEQCTVSGTEEAINAYKDKLAENQLSFTKVHTNHAFHSPLMAEAKKSFEQVCSSVPFGTPRIPYIANLTGEWMTEEDAVSPSYYGNHLQECVKFEEGLEKILSDDKAILIEVGPGHTLSTFVRQAQSYRPLGVLNTIRHPKEIVDDDAFLVERLGKLWTFGVRIDWEEYYKGQVRNRVDLPHYPFEKKKFPVGNGINHLVESINSSKAKIVATSEVVDTDPEIEEVNGITASQMLWESTLLPSLHPSEQKRTCLVLTNDPGGVRKLMDNLPRWRSFLVRDSDQYRYEGTLGGTIRNGNSMDMGRLIRDFREQAMMPNTIIIAHSMVRQIKSALRSLIYALMTEWIDNIPEVVVISPVSPVSNDLELVTMVRGLVIEYPDLSIRLVDAGCPLREENALETWTTILKREMDPNTNRYPVVSYVDGLRLVPKFREIEADNTGMKSLFHKGHLVLFSHEDMLDDSVVFQQSLENETGARVSILPYRIKSSSYNEKAIVNMLEEINSEQSEYLLDFRGEDLPDNLNVLYHKMDEYAVRLSIDFVNSVFPMDIGQTFNRKEFKEKLGVIPQLERYVDYFLHMFSEDGIVDSIGEDRYRITKNIYSLRSPNIIRNEIENLTPLFTGQLDLLEHSVRNFGPAFRGEIPSLKVLYPTEKGKEDLLLKSHRETIQEKEEIFTKQIFASMIKKIVDRKGKEKVRILEVGGGYGTMVREVAPLLKEMDVEFYFTDIGNSYLEALREYALVEELDFMHFGLFDITKEPMEQGLALASFDLVYGYNVVHATESLSTSLKNLQSLLKPGALLCVMERTTTRRYVDLIWGLLEGWWHFDKRERELSPLVSIDEWIHQFKQIGLEAITSFPEDTNLGINLDVGIIVGQRPVSNNHLGTKNRLPGAGNGTILPTVAESTLASLKSALDQKLRNIPDIQGIVLWDELRKGINKFERISPIVPEEVKVANCVNSYVIETATNFKKPGMIVSKVPMTHKWDSSITEWTINHEEIDKNPFSHRIYVPDGENYQINRIPNIMEGMLKSGIRQLVINGGDHPFFTVKPVRQEDSRKEKVTELKNMEILISQIWGELFGRTEIDIDADFFELGGDSFKLIQMTGNLEHKGYKVLMNEVYNYPTIRSLAKYINDKSNKNNQSIVTPKDMEDYLYEQTKISCSFQVVNGPKPLNVLLVNEKGSTGTIDTVRDQLRNIDVSNEMLPHYIFPLHNTEELQDLKDVRDLSELDYLSNLEKGQLQNIIENINRDQQLFENAIFSQPITKRYNLSSIQKAHFRGEVRLQFYLIEFHEMVDSSRLEQAFCDVIDSHGLLRSSLEKSLGKFRWREYAPPQKTSIPKLDISNLTLKAQERIMDWLAKTEWGADFKIADKLMYHVVLIKLNEQHYNLFFQFDHSIFDASSGATIRRQVFQRYNDLKKGVRTAMEASASYEEYLNQIHLGPIDISPEELHSKFDLARYSEYKRLVKSKFKKIDTGRIRTLQFSVDLNSFHLENSENENGAFEIGVQVYILVISRLLNIDAVPYDLLFQNRRYQGKNFSDVVGLVLDPVPFLIPVDRDNPSRMTALIRERIGMLNKHNINFGNLLRNIPTILRWRKIIKATGALNPIFYSPCLLNFVGISEMEYDKIWDYHLAQLDDEDQSKLNYGDFYGLFTTSNNQLKFLVFSKFMKDMEQLREVFNEELDHLMHVHAGKEADNSI